MAALQLLPHTGWLAPAPGLGALHACAGVLIYYHPLASLTVALLAPRGRLAWQSQQNQPAITALPSSLSLLCP